MICTRFVQIAGGRKQDMHKGKDILLEYRFANGIFKMYYNICCKMCKIGR